MLQLGVGEEGGGFVQLDGGELGGLPELFDHLAAISIVFRSILSMLQILYIMLLRQFPRLQTRAILQKELLINRSFTCLVEDSGCLHSLQISCRLF